MSLSTPSSYAQLVDLHVLLFRAKNESLDTSLVRSQRKSKRRERAQRRSRCQRLTNEKMQQSLVQESNH